MNKDLIQLVVFAVYVAMFSLWFLTTSGELLTLVIGVNLGVGLVGFGLSISKLRRPDKYRFLYEVNEHEKT